MEEIERKNTEYKELKYLSLAPQSSVDYEASSKLLYDKIMDESVYNIGIIAQYGAGKSSLIKTFKEIYENKQRKVSLNKSTNGKEKNDKQERIKTLNISLATFNIDKEIKEETINGAQCKNVIDQAIEKSILQQMLYKEERNDLPRSQIKRIKSFSTRKFLFISGLSAIILLSIFALTLFGMSLNGNKILAFKYSDVVYAVIGFGSLAFFAGGLLQFIEVSSIKLKDLELSFASKCNESLLNKFLDEVIYFFQKTKYNVVIFEDLDRFDNLSIFVKLRELNTILNSNRKLINKKRIKFVYAIRNDMFNSAEERSKFFDFIISIFPVLSPLNASSKIVEGLRECGFPKDWLPDDYVNDISYYFNDMRVLNSTINDCVQLVQNIDFSKISEKNYHKQNTSMFSLMAYKNIYPKEFVALEERKGELYDILARVSIKREKYIKDLANKIDGNNSYIEKLKYQLELNKNDLLLLVKGALLDINNRIKSPKGTELSDEVDYKYENMDLYLQVAKYETTDGYYYNRTTHIEYLYATVKQINEHIKGMTMVERYNAFVENNNSFASKQEALLTQNKKYQHEIDNYERNDFDFIKKHPDEVLNSENSAFLRMLLSNGYLDENYRDYLSKSGDSFMAENDKIFIKSVIQNEPLSLNNLKLTSPSVICSKLSLDKFNRVAILNNDFVNYIFSDNCSDRNKREVLSNQMKANNEDIKRFIAYYFNSENVWSIEFIKSMLARKDFFGIIKESNIDDEKIDNLFVCILEKISEDFIQKQDDVTYLIKRLMMNEDFNKNIVKFSNKLQFLQINSFRIKDLAKYEYSIEVLKILDNNRIWDLNYNDMIFILSNLYNYSENEIATKGYSLIIRLNSNTKGFILNNISYYVHEIMLVAEMIELETEDFIFLLENDDIELNDKHEIIKKQSSKVDFFDCEIDVLLLLFENDKINISLDQLVKEIETKEQLANSAIDFLVRNKSEYEGQKIKSGKVIYSIANYEGKDSICVLEELFDIIDIKIWDITKMQNDKSIAFLIERLVDIKDTDIDYICKQDFMEAQKHLASRFINSLIEKNLINSKISKIYVKYGENRDARIELYKLEEIDCIDDFSDAKKVLEDILHTPTKIAQRLYNKLMTMSIDKKRLFVSQLEFMGKGTIWERLPLVDACYSELIKNKKINIEKSDIVLEALYKRKLLRKTKKSYIVVD